MIGISRQSDQSDFCCANRLGLAQPQNPNGVVRRGLTGLFGSPNAIQWMLGEVATDLEASKLLYRCCQTNRLKHQKPWEREFYEAIRERHSVRTASRLSLKLVHLSLPLFAKKIEKHAQPPTLGGWLGFGVWPYPNRFLSA